MWQGDSKQEQVQVDKSRSENGQVSLHLSQVQVLFLYTFKTRQYLLMVQKRAHSKSPATLEPTLLVPDSEARTVVSFFPSSFSQRGTSDLGIAWKPPKWWGRALGVKVEEGASVVVAEEVTARTPAQPAGAWPRSDPAAWTGHLCFPPPSRLILRKQPVPWQEAGLCRFPFKVIVCQVLLCCGLFPQLSLQLQIRVLMDECLFIYVMLLSFQVQIHASEAGGRVCFLN